MTIEHVDVTAMNRAMDAERVNRILAADKQHFKESLMEVRDHLREGLSPAFLVELIDSKLEARA